jgi:hypothetical protein
MEFNIPEDFDCTKCLPPYAAKRLKLLKKLCEPDRYLEAVLLMTNPNNLDPPV